MCAMVLDIPYILQHVDFMAGEHLTEQYAQVRKKKVLIVIVIVYEIIILILPSPLRVVT